MRKAIYACMLVMGMLCTTTAVAIDDAGDFFVLGYGTKSCGAFIGILNKRNVPNTTDMSAFATESSYLGYMTGYLSGVNEHVNFGGKNVLASTDMEGAKAFVEKYCRENPLDDYFDTLVALRIKLIGE